MLEELLKYTKCVNGDIFTLGFSSESKLLKHLENNKKINNLISLTNKGKSGKKKKSLSGKTVKVSKIKNFLKNSRVNYTFIEYSSINKFLKTVIKDTIDITCEKIYFYFDINTNNIDEIIYRYERYGCKTKCIGNKNEYILIIDTKDIKTTFIKNIIYYLKDILFDIEEAIAFLLIGQ